MKAYVASRSPCPIGRASRLLGDRWVVLILREAFLDVDRFEDFLARLRISRATLTARLGWLVDAGILERHPADARRARYRLTPAGQAIEPLLIAMRDWADVWMPAPAMQKAPGPAGPDAPATALEGTKRR